MMLNLWLQKIFQATVMCVQLPNPWPTTLLTGIVLLMERIAVEIICSFRIHGEKAMTKILLPESSSAHTKTVLVTGHYSTMSVAKWKNLSSVNCIWCISDRRTSIRLSSRVLVSMYPDQYIKSFVYFTGSKFGQNDGIQSRLFRVSCIPPLKPSCDLSHTVDKRSRESIRGTTTDDNKTCRQASRRVT